MKNIKSHFVFSRSEQNGIFLLVVIIIILQLIYFFVDFRTTVTHSAEDELEMAKFQAYIDSVKSSSEENKEPATIYPFNPNFITDFKGYSLGMTPSEIDRLHLYRAEGKWINSSEDFQKVTGVSDSLLNVLSPYFKFPVWVTSEASKVNQEKRVTVETGPKRDLNEATAEDLMELDGIGEVLAGRIINYRNKIGGFLSDIQLKDIYGLNYDLRNEVEKYFTVKDPPEHKIYNINEASLLELSEVPYIGYELAREIINYRLLNQKISNFEELAKLKDFPSEKIDRIALYLRVK